MLQNSWAATITDMKVGSKYICSCVYVSIKGLGTLSYVSAFPRNLMADT